MLTHVQLHHLGCILTWSSKMSGFNRTTTAYYKNAPFVGFQHNNGSHYCYCVAQ